MRSSRLSLPELDLVRTAWKIPLLETVSTLPTSTIGTSGLEPWSSTNPRSSTSLSWTKGSTGWASSTVPLKPSQLSINLEFFCHPSSWGGPTVISCSTAALAMLIHLWYLLLTKTIIITHHKFLFNVCTLLVLKIILIHYICLVPLLQLLRTKSMSYSNIFV